MTAAIDKRRRMPRSDAIANRARIIDVANDMLRAGDRSVSLEAVAREAGVGIGTLYRHFTSREALAAAVYHREVDELVALAATLGGRGDPADALRRWLRATVDFVATKKGMAEALSWSARAPADLTDYASDHLTEAVNALLRRAIGERSGRDGLGGQDLLRVLVALCYEFDQPGWQERVSRLLDALIDGLIQA